ncbi:MAG: amidohydrolase family protein [Solirubrobacteraceae bacterium]
MHADDLLGAWYRHVVELLPPVDLLDAHTHIGEHDPDGFRCTPAELTAALEPVGSRAVVFAMHEPDGYPEANDWVIAAAAATNGRLTPFCRVNPRDDARRELERCLSAGAKGLKLHPRAERFSMGAAEVRGLFEVVDEARVPVLVHAGRGIPALGEHALALATEFPRVPLILAHAGVSDLSWLAGQTRRHPNLLFDTAWMSPPDLLALFTLVPPGQILYATDLPYGSPIQTGIMTFRCALQAGLAPAALEAVAGGQLVRLLAGEEPLDLGPAPGPPAGVVDPLLMRIVYYLAWASALTTQGIDAVEMMDLARLACVVGDRAPQADLCRSISALVDLAAAAPLGEALQDRFVRFQLLSSAGTLAATPAAGAPASA